MKTSFPELQNIEGYLTKSQSPEKQLLNEARMLVDQPFRQEVYWQGHTYQIIREYARMEIRQELEQLHQELFKKAEHRSFRNLILRLFNV